jgi:hypothetical protein
LLQPGDHAHWRSKATPDGCGTTPR